MTQRKVFIGISLPDQLKKRVLAKIEKWRDLPIKWLSEKNFHITISFIGYVDDEVIADICQKVRAAVESAESFGIVFEKIALAPSAEDPRMVWLEGELSEDLKNLEKSISQELGTFVAERKEFRPHVTLGKLRSEKWAALPEKPVIDEKFSASVSVDTVEIFEGREENGKKVYSLIESCPLK